jgi:hypothetical protein
MRTTPSTIAQIAIAAGVAPVECFTGCGRRVGDRVEVDLDEVARRDETVARWAENYFESARRLWAHLKEQPISGEVLAVRRPLVKVHQSDSKRDGRADLRDELAGLEQYGGFHALLDALLGPEVSRTDLEEAAGAWQREIDISGSRVQVKLWVCDPVAWSDAVGGPAGPGEVARIFTLVAQHAPWRDRRVRRLVALNVEAEELWPAVSAAPATGRTH